MNDRAASASSGEASHLCGFALASFLLALIPSLLGGLLIVVGLFLACAV